jgi:hypothetical protein
MRDEFVLGICWYVEDKHPVKSEEAPPTGRGFSQTFQAEPAALTPAMGGTGLNQRARYAEKALP